MPKKWPSRPSRWNLPLIAVAPLLGVAALGISAQAAAQAPGAASGRCTAPEAHAFVRSAKKTTICRLRGWSRCPVRPPPACSGDALDDFVELVFGDASGERSSHLSAQRRCQRTIARSSFRFLQARLEERMRGERSTLRSARKLGRIGGRTCRVSITEESPGQIVPSLGASCEDVVGAPGDLVDGAGAARCLRPALGRIVEAVSPRSMPPNIVVIMTDDQRSDTLPVMPVVSDRLAGAGIEFTESFPTTSVCAASRASFLSGQYARTTGILRNRPPDGGAAIFDGESSFPAQLQRAGYTTALFGKYINATDLLEERPAGWNTWHAFVQDGFNFFDYDLNEDGQIAHYGSSEGDYSTDLLRDRAVRFIEEEAQTPFFLDFAPYAPHFDSTFFSTTPAPRHQGTFDGLPPFRPPSYREADVSDKPPHVQASSDSLWDTIESTGQNDDLRLDMLESLLAIDEAVEAILNSLETHGLTDHTMVVYTADNGYLWGEHQLTGKNHAYEESIRVPLIIHYPMLVSAPRRESSLVLNIDLAPTFLELAGAEPETELPGRSLAGLLKSAEAATTWRRDFFGEHYLLHTGIFSTLFPLSHHNYVRGPIWKYVEHQDPVFLELYHLPTDPYELENKAQDPNFNTIVVDHFNRLRDLINELP